MNQIIEAFGFGEIELAVLKRASREFARLGRTQTVDAAQSIEHRSDHRAAAMDMKFSDVFAGGAVRPRKPERHRFVDGTAVEIAKRCELGEARRGQICWSLLFSSSQPCCSNSFRSYPPFYYP